MLGILAAGAPGHLSATEIHQRLHAGGWEADESAVHRALVAFTELGLVHHLPASGPPAYGLSDPPHHHALCVQCGLVVEIPPPVLMSAVAVVEDAVRFRLVDGGLALRGVCADCQPRPQGDGAGSG